MRALLALTLMSSIGLADPAKDALAKGRKLANQKHYGEAIAAFEEGLKAKPDDPTQVERHGTQMAGLLVGGQRRAKYAARRNTAGRRHGPPGH